VSFNAMNVIKISGGSQGYSEASVVGDFNRDGREDMVEWTNASGGTLFHLLISTGTGAYSPSTSYSLPNGAVMVGQAVGDFNRDGKLDLAIAAAKQSQNSSQYYLFIYLGEGNGTFQSPITIPLSFNPSAVVAADVNHDGKMDLVLLNAPSSGSTVVTYFGNGSGGFTEGPSSPFGSNYALNDVGDFDGDGKADLFTADCVSGGCTFTVYYGDGAGHFGTPTSLAAPKGFDPSVGDVDGDGKSDIITSTMGDVNSPDQPFLSVFYGAANRTLTLGQVPTTQCTFGKPVVADFNGDHIPDIVFPEHDCADTSTGSAQIAFLAGKGNRTFGSEQTLFNSTYQQYPAGNTTVLRANNSDSKPDFFFTQNASTGTPPTQDYYVIVNTSSGTFAHCNAPNSSTGFRICSPGSGSRVSSPVKFSIGASGQVPMRKVEVWADGVKKYEQLYAFSRYAYLDASIALSKGTHAITVVAAGWDNSLQSKKYSITVQ
jgi:hypothetical protein